MDYEKVLSLLKLEDDHIDSNADNGDERKHAKNRKSFRYKLRSSIFMFLYLVAKDANMSSTSAYIVAVISMLQLLVFPFKSKHFKWNESFVSSVLPKLEIAGFEFINDAEGSIPLIAFIGTLALVGLTAAFSLWIGVQFWSHGTVRHLSVLPILQLVVRLLTTILYIPAVTILMSFFDCEGWVGSRFPCNDSMHTILGILVGLVLLLFVVFNMIAVLVFVVDDPESPHALAEVHGRVDCVNLFIRACLSVFFAVVSEENTHILISAVVLSGVAMTGSYFFYLPFLKNEMNRLFVATNGLYLWAGICLVLAELIGEREDYGAVATFLLGGPMAMIMLSLAVIVRERHLMDDDVHPKMSQYIAELILRFKLQPRASNWQNIRGEYRRTVDEMFPSSAFLNLHLANLYERCGQNSLLAGQYIRRASSIQDRSFDHSFFVFRYNKQNLEKSNGTSGALGYVAFTHHRQKAEKCIVESLKLMFEMWTILSTPNHTADQLFKAASKIHEQSTIAKSHLDQLVMVSKSSPRSLLLYSVYAQEIMNDPRLAKKLQKAAKLMAQSGESYEDEFHSNHTAILTISGNEASLGQIQDATDSVMKMFGYDRKQLIGKQIEELCPPPFNHCHHRFLQAYIEKGEVSSSQARRVWVRHSAGYAIACDLRITPTQDRNGNLELTGKCSLGKTDTEFLAVDSTGSILFFSKTVMAEFGLRNFVSGKDGETLPLKDFTISKVVPALNVFGDLTDLFTVGPAGEAPPNRTETVYPGEGERYLVTARPMVYHGRAIAVMFLFEAQESMDQEDDDVGYDAFSEDEQSQQRGDMARVESFTKLEPPPLPKMSRERHPAERDTEQSTVPNEVEDKAKGSVLRIPSVATMSIDDETASIGSAGTSSSSRTIHTVHKSVENRIQTEEMRLSRFQRLCYGLSALFATLAVISFAAQGNVFSLFFDAVQLLFDSSARAANVAELHLAMMQKLVAEFEGYPMPGEIISVVKSTSSKVRDLHNGILEKEVSMSPTYTFMEDPQGVIELSPNGIFVHSSVSRSIQRLATVGEAFLENAHAPCDDSCQYVVNNAGWEVLDSAIKASELYKQSAVGHLDELVRFNTTIFAVSSTLVLLIVVFQLVPLLFEIRNTKETMNSAMGKLPKNMLAMLRKRCLNKVASVKHAMENLQTDNLKFLEKSRKQDVMEYLILSRDRDDPDAPEVDNDSIFRGNSSTFLPPCTTGEKRPPKSTRVVPVSDKKTDLHPKGRNERRRAHMKNSLAFMMTLVILVIPLLAIVAYFFLVVLVSVKVRNTANMECGTLYNVGRRWATLQRLGRAVNFHHDASAPEWSRFKMYPEYNTTSEAIEFLGLSKYLTKVILYGSEEEGTSTLLTAQGTPLFNLEYNNACVDEICQAASAEGSSSNIINDLHLGLGVTVDRFLLRAEEDIYSQNATDKISLNSYIALSNSIQTSFTLYMDHLSKMTEKATDQVRIMSICFAVSVWFIFALIYKIFARINNELKNAQYVLLLLPPEVFRTVPEIKRLTQ